MRQSTLNAMLPEEEAKMLRKLAYATLFTTALVGSGAYAGGQ